MTIRTALAMAAVAVALGSGCASTGGNASGLAGHWTLDADRTAAVQPKNQRNNSNTGSMMPHATVAVGGVALPMPGSAALPSVGGTPRDPRVLQTSTLTIEPAGDDRLTLAYDGGKQETLKRGDDQGLVSDWGRQRLSSSYETTSRKVSQVYQLERDGSLLVTVQLDPDQGPAVVDKRVFVRTAQNDAAP